MAGLAAEPSARKLLTTQCLGWASSYGQCGGVECPNGSGQCSDSAYLCCPSDFSCQRLNKHFWSCYPEGSAVGFPTTAPVPAPSGMSEQCMPVVWKQFIAQLEHLGKVNQLMLLRPMVHDCAMCSCCRHCRHCLDHCMLCITLEWAVQHAAANCACSL